MIDEDHKLQHLTNFFFPRMYDVDGNGVIDQEEMTKIVQVKPTYNTIPCPTKSTPKYCKKYCCLPWNTANWDSNFPQWKTPINLLAHIANNLWINSLEWENGGNIRLKCYEMQAIYDMLGAGAVKPTDTAEERAKNIFNR